MQLLRVLLLVCLNIFHVLCKPLAVNTVGEDGDDFEYEEVGGNSDDSEPDIYNIIHEDDQHIKYPELANVSDLDKHPEQDNHYQESQAQQQAVETDENEENFSDKADRNKLNPDSTDDYEIKQINTKVNNQGLRNEQESTIEMFDFSNDNDEEEKGDLRYLHKDIIKEEKSNAYLEVTSDKTTSYNWKLFPRKIYHGRVINKNILSSKKKYADNELDTNYRDRRQSQEINNNNSTQIADSKHDEMKAATNMVMMKTDKEGDIKETEEAAAIKRNIRKLSADELKELLNSLTKNKRELLTRIMENNESILKRETNDKSSIKKHKYFNNKHYAANKSQAKINVNSDFRKMSDINYDSDTLGSSTPNINDSNENLQSDKLDDSLNSSESSDYQTGKIKAKIQTHLDEDHSIKINTKQAPSVEEKREAMAIEDLGHIDDINILEKYINWENDQKDGYFESNDNLSQSDNDGNTDLGKSQREINIISDQELSQSLNSLQESFPNSIEISGPHIRVKRTGYDFKERASDFIPGAKLINDQNITENIDEERVTKSEALISLLGYHKSDFNVPLQENYDGEFSKYKRIRRVRST